jgi:pectate lyase
MKHNTKLTTKEKINIWIDLCEFSSGLMESAMSKKELKKRLKRIRSEHLRRDKIILEKIGRLE